MKVSAFIMAGGEGKRLFPLTKERAKSAVPFGGRYRIIDFVLSNFVNSGFYNIKVLTQYKSNSLNEHILRAWRLTAMLGHGIDPVPPQMRKGPHWYRGTADAVYQNLHMLDNEDPDYVCVFGGDHIYKMDIRQMLNYHIEKKADITVAVIPVPISQAKSFGIAVVDHNWKIQDFEEKPDNPKSMPQDKEKVLASIGNYIFNRDVLVKLLEEDSNKETGHDFGTNIIPTAISQKSKVYAYNFFDNEVPGVVDKEKGYWRDVGTIEAYWQANMDLVSVSPAFNLYNYEWPIMTLQLPCPPAKFVFADEAHKRVGIATDSVVAEGCIISGGKINRSVLFPKVRINSYSSVTESILMEGVNIGRYAKVKRAIIDKNVNIPEKMEIGFNPEEDKKRFHVKNGIVVINREMMV